MGAGAAVEDADVVEAEKATLEDVLTEAVPAICPPGEVQHQLVERPPEEVYVCLAAQSLLGAMKEEGRPGMNRRVHVTEIPLVSRDLPAGMQVNPLEHQLHLFFGEVGVHDRQRKRVEGQIPSRVPGILHLSGIEMTSLFNMWNHSEFRELRYPE